MKRALGRFAQGQTTNASTFASDMEGRSTSKLGSIMITANGAAAMLPLGDGGFGRGASSQQQLSGGLAMSQGQSDHASSHSPGWLHRDTDALDGLKMHIRRALQLDFSEDGKKRRDT